MARAKGAKHAKKKTELWFDLPWRSSRESFFSVRRFSRTVGKSLLLGERVIKRDRKENLSRRHKDTKMRISAVLPPWLREKKSSYAFHSSSWRALGAWREFLNAVSRLIVSRGESIPQG